MITSPSSITNTCGHTRTHDAMLIGWTRFGRTGRWRKVFNASSSSLIVSCITYTDWGGSTHAAMHIGSTGFGWAWNWNIASWKTRIAGVALTCRGGTNHSAMLIVRTWFLIAISWSIIVTLCSIIDNPTILTRTSTSAYYSMTVGAGETWIAHTVIVFSSWTHITFSISTVAWTVSLLNLHITPCSLITCKTVTATIVKPSLLAFTASNIKNCYVDLTEITTPSIMTIANGFLIDYFAVTVTIAIMFSAVR